MGRGADMMSKEGYETWANTGCSDWEAQQIGKFWTTSSDLNCLNKCLMLSGARYANFQADVCHDATLGAHSGACYCFSGCTMVENACWELISTSLVSSDTPVGNVSAASAMSAAEPAGSTTTSTTGI